MHHLLNHSINLKKGGGGGDVRLKLNDTELTVLDIKFTMQTLTPVPLRIGTSSAAAPWPGWSPFGPVC